MSTKDDFCNLPVQNCYDWLKLNCEGGYGKVEDFIKKYGHRGVQEVCSIIVLLIKYNVETIHR